ncbi:MAG: DNA double-strand break repair nuclease NurA, partial [Candidatus Bathyarchaeota archaeon]
ELTFYPVSKRLPFREVAGADAGSQVLPLASRRYAVISALVYTLPSGERFFLEPESHIFPHTSGSERFSSVVNVNREARLYETAERFLEKRRPQLLLLDGPLAFSNWWSMAGREEDRQRLVEAVRSLLDFCMREEITVAGVVKRPSARYLVYSLGLQRETDLPDSFLMLQTLKPGERTDIFSPRLAIQKAVRTSPFMDTIGHPIYSFYVRLSAEWSIPPVRIDLPAFSLCELEDVADYCHGSSFWRGIPLPIVRADEEVRITKRFIGEVYRDILDRVSRRTGEISYLAPCWGEGRWMGA